MALQTHIAILGAGPGGYVATIRAAELGARVTVVEREKVGGVCLNWGCIPSEALPSVIELGDKVKKAADLGLVLQGPATDVQVAGMIRARPTLAEGMMEAAEDVEGAAIHLVRKRTSR